MTSSVALILIYLVIMTLISSHCNASRCALVHEVLGTSVLNCSEGEVFVMLSSPQLENILYAEITCMDLQNSSNYLITEFRDDDTHGNMVWSDKVKVSSALSSKNLTCNLRGCYTSDFIDKFVIPNASCTLIANKDQLLVNEDQLIVSENNTELPLVITWSTPKLLLQYLTATTNTHSYLPYIALIIVPTLSTVLGILLLIIKWKNNKNRGNYVQLGTFLSYEEFDPLFNPIDLTSINHHHLSLSFESIIDGRYKYNSTENFSDTESLISHGDDVNEESSFFKKATVQSSSEEEITLTSGIDGVDTKLMGCKDNHLFDKNSGADSYDNIVTESNHFIQYDDSSLGLDLLSIEEIASSHSSDEDVLDTNPDPNTTSIKSPILHEDETSVNLDLFMNEDCGSITTTTTVTYGEFTDKVNLQYISEDLPILSTLPTVLNDLHAHKNGYSDSMNLRSGYTQHDSIY